MRVFFLLFLYILFAPIVSHAEGQFFVSGIHAHKSAESGEKARDKAVAEAEKKAFEILMVRLNPSEGAAIAAKTPASRISALVTEMQVYNERVTGAYYTADFSFNFHPGAATNIARGIHIEPKKNISVYHSENRPAGYDRMMQERSAAYGYQDTYPRERGSASVYSASPGTEDSVMLLPVLEEGGAARQWERDTPWMRTWRGMSGGDTFYNVPQKTAPILHPSLIEYIRSGQLTEEDRLRIVRFLQPYGPSHTSYMIYGRYRYDPRQQSALIDATLYELAPKFRALLQHTVKMNIGEAYEVFINRAGQELFEKSRSYFSVNDTNKQQLRTTQGIRNHTSGSFNKNAGCRAAPHTEPFIERMIISAYTLPEWLNVKGHIEKADGITGVSSVSMTPGRMVVDLSHHCSSGEALAQSMAKAGLSYDPGEGVIFMPNSGTH